MSIKNISVFCGAHLGNNPIYASEAKKVAEVIVEKGMNVVFGGGDVGLMGVVSHTAIDNGGEVLGISLQSLYELELTNPRIQEVVVAKTLLERKDIFMQRSDAFIVLPGGVGSLDELAEVMCSNQLGIINKPIGILNTNGYYDHLLAWMKKAVEEGFVSDANFNELIVSDSCADLIERVASEKRPADDDWTNRLGL
ncbi:TIGR00730 family Rossman fold protein [Gammaproteobacteria bacterium]|nr:TIGR00730 family Rossman fold protein [Gammaproteobacteria bacterium]MDA7800690.1 TIGR00730 family Rossman fold protein [Gammaproteobacteria bacterium]MDA7811892.1 TIGR00730 family Rossman fold protein [Gammaproteobacteria bacterium]MDA8674223.1 TIGR00730 family Rossman fold protein [Gammaproteobacteria bacterium]MDA8683613.1 TIGR00730 family Rossman fold protein [Gammaproteobacteria bacterium]|tara:strand:- start:33 stop:620 length:588 start_codon:yes stop_codon:yes gene_type:complete